MQVGVDLLLACCSIVIVDQQRRPVLSDDLPTMLRVTASCGMLKMFRSVALACDVCCCLNAGAAGKGRVLN